MSIPVSTSSAWAACPLGEPALWPPALRLTSEIMFNSPLAMLLVWGERNITLFNDAYAQLAGPRHPPAPGGTVPPLWPPPLAAATAAFERARLGESTQQHRQDVVFVLADGLAKRELDLYFTPIRDAAGAVAGVLCAMQPSAAAPASAAPQGLRILVVEDNLDSQYLVCEMLRAFGHDTDGVASGEDALEKLADTRYDVLFSDVSLPGISGIELARRALAASPRLQVIFASGYGDSLLSQVEFPYQSLLKPFDIEQLQQALRAIAANLSSAP